MGVIAPAFLWTSPSSTTLLFSPLSSSLKKMYNGTLSSDPVVAAAEILEVAQHITVTRYVDLSFDEGRL